jgi:hypothetical protein
MTSINIGYANMDSFNFLTDLSANASATVGHMIDVTTYETSSATPTAAGYETFATTPTGIGIVTLYAPFWAATTLNQAQVLIHEAVHDAFSLTDQQLASALTGDVYGNTTVEQSRASNDFQTQLKQKCN